MIESNATDLITASASGDLAKVHALLDAGADPGAEVGDRSDEAAQTPLGVAVQRGHHLVVELLLDRGASLRSLGWAGCDLVTTALLAGHLLIADLLRRRGAKAEMLLGLCFVEDGAAVHEILRHEPKQWSGYFLDAIRAGSVAMVEDNIRVNPNQEAEKLRMSLIGSAIFQWRLVHWYPRKVNGVDDGFDRRNYQTILRRLLEWGVDANLRDDKGDSILHRCATVGRMWSPTEEERAGHAQLLIEFGADVNARDEKGRTPLAVACQHKREILTLLLLQHGAKE